MRKVAVVTVCLLFLSASFVHAEFYRWVDKDGKEFFTNEREKVPQEYRNTASAVNPDERRVSVGADSVPAGRPAAHSTDHKDKYGRGEGHWRKRAVKLRKELAILQDKYDLFLKQERDDDRKTHASSSSYKRKKSQSKREKQKSVLERDLAWKKHELEVELPEEARKADAYPGWLRE